MKDKNPIVVIIAANKNRGKSSVIRGLTGIHGKRKSREAIVFIKKKDKQIIKVFTLIDSIQEKPIKNNLYDGGKLKATALDLVSIIKKNRSIDCFLFPSWHKGNVNRNNSLIDIVSAFQREKISYRLFILDEIPNNFNPPNCYVVADKSTINSMVHEIRNQLDWL